MVRAPVRTANPKQLTAPANRIRDMSIANRFGEHRGSTANCSSLASMSARPPWQNPWRGEGSQQVIGVGGRVVRIAILQSGRV
jgi:hypothetical protein